VRRLRPISFNWKENGLADIGLGAEEVAQVAPSFVSTNRQGEIVSVKYDQLSALFINAFKEQQAQIGKLQAQAWKQKQVIREEQSELNKLKSQITERQKQIAARNQDRDNERSELTQLRAEVERLAAMVRTNNGGTVQASVSGLQR
jgi:chromosome segregation ATPase